MFNGVLDVYSSMQFFFVVVAKLLMMSGVPRYE